MAQRRLKHTHRRVQMYAQRYRRTTGVWRDEPSSAAGHAERASVSWTVAAVVECTHTYKPAGCAIEYRVRYVQRLGSRQVAGEPEKHTAEQSRGRDPRCSGFSPLSPSSLRWAGSGTDTSAGCMWPLATLEASQNDGSTRGCGRRGMPSL